MLVYRLLQLVDCQALFLQFALKALHFDQMGRRLVHGGSMVIEDFFNFCLEVCDFGFELSNLVLIKLS